MACLTLIHFFHKSTRACSCGTHLSRLIFRHGNMLPDLQERTCYWVAKSALATSLICSTSGIHHSTLAEATFLNMEHSGGARTLRRDGSAGILCTRASFWDCQGSLRAALPSKLFLANLPSFPFLTGARSSLSFEGLPCLRVSPRWKVC